MREESRKEVIMSNPHNLKLDERLWLLVLIMVPILLAAFPIPFVFPISVIWLVIDQPEEIGFGIIYFSWLALSFFLIHLDEREPRKKENTVNPNSDLKPCTRCKTAWTTLRVGDDPVCSTCKAMERPPFEVAPWRHPLNTDGWQLFRVGTCNGQWRATATAYQILSIINDQPGNGNFHHTLKYFEESCRRDNRDLEILEVDNLRLQGHLLKIGFTCFSANNYRKTFKQ